MDPALAELQEVYHKGDLVLFVGAGVSVAAGLPSWLSLVSLLVEHARARGTAAAVVQEIEDLARQQKLIDAITAAKDTLGDTEFCSVVERNLNDHGRDLPAVAKVIATLAPQLRALLTTNIDHLLERAVAGTMPTLPRATGDIAQRSGFLLKLHGTLLDRDTWVFSRDQYERAIYADPKLQTAFTALFNARTLLFVGYGLADADFDLVISRLRALAGGQPPRHYALVASETVTPYRQRQLENAGIRLIPYPNHDGRHSEVVRILCGMAGATPESVTAVDTGASTGGTAGSASATPAPAGPIGGTGVRMKGVKSRKGGVHASDGTGRGIDLEDIEAENDVTAHTEAKGNGPKA
jgi:hypothetical protein